MKKSSIRRFLVRVEALVLFVTQTCLSTGTKKADEGLTSGDTSLPLHRGKGCIIASSPGQAIHHCLFTRAGTFHFLVTRPRVSYAH